MRYDFIKNPCLFDYSKECKIRIVENNIYLLSKTNINSTYVEYHSYAKYLNLKSSYNKNNDNESIEYKYIDSKNIDVPYL